MAKSCAIIPQVINKKGQTVDSKLFTDLLVYSDNNRKDAIRLYLTTKNDRFIKDFNSKLDFDDNNEPTLKSLLKETNFSNIITESKIEKKLNKDIGYYKIGTNKPNLIINNDENNNELVKKAISFNRNSEFKDSYVANIINTINPETYDSLIGIKVEKRNAINSNKAKQMEYNSILNEKLRNILASHNIKIGSLTDLERRIGINGVTDFSVAKSAAEGMIEIIRLANGIEGEKALPEEFAHFAIEAMGDSPIISRLINYIHSNELVEEILGEEYETYNSLYKGNTEKLSKEAAGKLLAKHLLKSEPIGQKPYKNLLERVISAIKSLFIKINPNQIQKAIYEADREFGKLARDILNGRMDEEININNINSSELFYNTNERIQRDKNLLRKIIDNELKRLKIYEKRNPNGKFDSKQKLFINKLELSLIKNNEIEAVYSFLDNTLNVLQQLNTRLEELREDSAKSIKEKAILLRDIRNYIYSYNNIIKEIRDVLLDEQRYEDNRYGDRAKVVLDNVSTLIGDLFSIYNKLAMPLFVDFIKPFIGEKIKIPFGKFKNKVFTAEDLVSRASQDISFFDRWLDSMADSSDYILKIIDQAVKKRKEKARLNTIDVSKKLQAAAIKLEKAGIKNTDWMFERDNEGNLSGSYISEINYSLFKNKQREMYKSLSEKYGDYHSEDEHRKYKKELEIWYKTNTENINGIMYPKKSIYGNKVFENLNMAQKEYYDTIMEIKKELDSYIPNGYTTLTNIVKIRKDLLERVKSSENIKSGVKQLWEGIKDEFIVRTDDVDFSDKAAIKDFEGNEVQNLPLYYIKLKKGENLNDMSTDITSTLTAYAAMANDYKEMSEIIDTLEIGRDLMREREIEQVEGGRPLIEKFKINDRILKSNVIKKGSGTNFVQRLNDFFEMQVYGRYMADEGTFGKTDISKAKVANFVNKVTSMNNLAFNIISGISNLITGKVMMRIESFSGEFFNEKNTITADRIYGKHLPSFLSEIGNRIKVSKLALWNELFNTLQDYEQVSRGLNFDRKTWFSKMLNTSTLFFMNNAGEHWMQTRTSLALADAYKMKSPSGKIVNLWDAMEVVYLDENNKKLGAKLQIKEGYTKEDGTKFTEGDIIRFSRKSAAINERMHGIYNKADRSAVQRLAIGRMGIMYRKWIKPSLNRRYKSASYNYDLDEWVEGYYITTGRFLANLVKDLREAQFNIAARWEELTPTEKSNIKRAIVEVGHFLAVMAIIGLIDWSDDDEDSTSLIKMVELQARRLYTELGALIPGKTMISEGLRILKSPAAGINTVEDAINLIKLLNPLNYTDEIQSGRYKGHSTAYKSFFESPIIPMYKTIYRGFHPEEVIPFYKQ